MIRNPTTLCPICDSPLPIVPSFTQLVAGDCLSCNGKSKKKEYEYIEAAKNITIAGNKFASPSYSPSRKDTILGLKFDYSGKTTGELIKDVIDQLLLHNLFNMDISTAYGKYVAKTAQIPSVDFWNRHLCPYLVNLTPVGYSFGAKCKQYTYTKNP